MKPDYIDGLTVLGGEPFEYVNQKELLPFLERVRDTFPEKTIWMYTGYIYEEDLLERMVPKWKVTEPILSLIDVLVDGPFVEEEKDISLPFRGSANQRIIDVKKSRKEGRTILWTGRQDS